MQFRLTLLALLISATLSAQVEYGKITYLQTSEISFNLGEEDEPETAQDKEIKAMFAKMQAGGAFDKNYEATFSPSAFSFAEIIRDAAEMTTETGSGMVVTIMTSDDEPTHFHTNTVTGAITNKDNIADRSFLVSGTPAPVRWEMTGEKVPPSEMTAGLDLLVAIGITENNDTITAGYAPSLPVQVGPKNYYGLPGAIITLEIPMGKEKTVYRATGIELSSEPIDVDQPTEGKPMSLEKFHKEVAKRRKMEIRRFGN